MDAAGDDLAGLLGQLVDPARILAEHTNDGHGRCTVCSLGHDAPRQRWPCRLFELAVTAQARSRGRR